MVRTVATLKQVRAALTDVISTKCGIDTRPYFPDTVTPPMVSFFPGNPPISFGGTMNEQLEVMGDPLAPSSPNGYRLQVVAIVSRTVTEDAQELIEELMDSGSARTGGLLSIPDALVFDSTLNGVVEWCFPLEVTTIGLLEVAGQSYLHGRLNITVSS